MQYHHEQKFLSKSRQAERRIFISLNAAKIVARLERGRDNHGDPIGPKKERALRARLEQYKKSLENIEKHGAETLIPVPV